MFIVVLLGEMANDIVSDFLRSTIKLLSAANVFPLLHLSCLMSSENLHSVVKHRLSLLVLP